jgi:uncharacterized protein YjbI with pentapeptide repeats
MFKEISQSDFDAIISNFSRLTSMNLTNLKTLKENPLGFNFATVSDCKLNKMDLSGTNLFSASFLLCDMRGINLSNIKVTYPNRGAAFKLSDIALKAEFIQCDLRYADFSGAELFYTSFSQCDLSGAEFNGADISNCTFSECLFSNAQIKSFKADHGVEVCSFIKW